MRTLGDLCWINKYVGIPYEFGGRDLDGLDCYGLVKRVYADQYQTQLPDWQVDPVDLRGVNDTIVSVVQSGDFEELQEPVEGCFVICHRTRAAYHIGLYYGGGVLHCVDGIGTVYEPMTRFKHSYPNLSFGEWSPCL